MDKRQTSETNEKNVASLVHSVEFFKKQFESEQILNLKHIKEFQELINTKNKEKEELTREIDFLKTGDSEKNEERDKNMHFLKVALEENKKKLKEITKERNVFKSKYKDLSVKHEELEIARFCFLPFVFSLVRCVYLRNIP